MLKKKMLMFLFRNKKLKNGAITPLDTFLRPLVQCLRRQIGTFLLKKVLKMNVNGL